MILNKLKKVGNWYIVVEAGGRPVAKLRTRQQAHQWITDNKLNDLKKLILHKAEVNAEAKERTRKVKKYKNAGYESGFQHEATEENEEQNQA